MDDAGRQDDRKTQAEAPSNAEARAVEAAAIRRRWITLGEVLAVAAVLISALTLWNSWSERQDGEIARSAETRKAATKAAALVLSAASVEGDALALKTGSGDQSVQGQTILFPSALGVSPVETTGEPRIEADWFDKALKKARNDARLPDDSRGDERLPVAITTRFLVNGEAHEAIALYDIGYTITGRWLSGHKLTLRGLSFVSRSSGRDQQAKVDARWKTLIAP